MWRVGVQLVTSMLPMGLLQALGVYDLSNVGCRKLDGFVDVEHGKVNDRSDHTI